MIRFSLAALALVALLSLANPTLAGSCCDVCGNKCGPKLVAKQIMVPITITETRLKTCIVKNMVEKEESYTEFKRVPVKKTYEKETCYLEDEIKTQTVTKKHCKRVKNQVVRTEAIKVPVKEIREGVRRKEVCTECGKVCIEEPCTCCIHREKSDVRTRCYEVDDVVFETCKKEISYCVKTPKKKKEFCAEETTYELVPVEKTRKVMCCVPEIVKKPVETQVTKHFPKTIYCCENCRKHDLASLSTRVCDLAERVQEIDVQAGPKLAKLHRKHAKWVQDLHKKKMAGQLGGQLREKLGVGKLAGKLSDHFKK